MNFLGLVQRLRQEAGASGTGPLTTANQTGELQRLVNWINDAWLDIQSLRTDWDWMRSTFSFPTVSSQGIYTTSQMGIPTWSNVDVDTLRNYVNPAVVISISSPAIATLATHGLNINDTIIFSTTGTLPTGVVAGQTYYVTNIVDANNLKFSASLNGTPVITTGTQNGTHTMSSSNTNLFVGLRSEVQMSVISYDEWRDNYYYGALRSTQSRPIEFALPPTKGISLGPVPVAGYTVLGDYFQQPSYMANDTDIPGLPTQFHMAIVWKALTYYGQYEESAAVIQRGDSNFRNFKRRLMNDQSPEIDFGGSIA